LSAQVIEIISDRTGIHFDYRSSSSWSENIEMVKIGEVDMFSFITPTPEREKYLTFTNPYQTYNQMIFARDDQSYLANVDDLCDKRVCVIKGYATLELLERQSRCESSVEVNNVDEALVALSNGDADVFIGLLLPTTEAIRKLGVSNIKVIGEVPDKVDLCMAARS
jgi:ABC-type amino acid transport substrate-binding protein